MAIYVEVSYPFLCVFVCQAPEWSDEDISLLSRNMVKFPGGTPGRWEKIAHELGRSVADVRKPC